MISPSVKPLRIKNEDSNLLQEQNILPRADANEALEELINLQKALMSDEWNDDLEESSVASSQMFDCLQSDDSIFSNNREQMMDNNVYGNSWMYICIRT